ncbi:MULTISPECIES: DUF2249 domain-containing protein [unclassified Bacillus (in: firmicutes)]|uniref:DUF2249 domain-containing protein n=1 Tax=unclassified Bacillus (in: firmicutes) TaxID=185979 RepID=UPI001BECE656|nr:MULTISPECIES: DUF2249 domain-containing protein [unclassified Bacillus (in: firmicutes)]MBT2639047.1 DUF2249 domain-containing protein [Bacillus sp. ISL-39]MBT2641993.1 DUF2249 domain-containing protein [Bacillus sp. ISL-41]MBT2662344.1 DUF2249 domain-containing protein [Bacillus sp. ISL-45]
MEHRTIELDVREDINNKLEPFQKIMEAIGDLELNDRLVLHAPFKPVPLYGVLKAKGFEHVVEKIEAKHYKITFTKKGGK